MLHLSRSYHLNRILNKTHPPYMLIQLEPVTIKLLNKYETPADLFLQGVEEQSQGIVLLC
jgi:hypothetical protein